MPFPYEEASGQNVTDPEWDQMQRRAPHALCRGMETPVLPTWCGARWRGGDATPAVGSARQEASDGQRVSPSQPWQPAAPSITLARSLAVRPPACLSGKHKRRLAHARPPRLLRTGRGGGGDELHGNAEILTAGAALRMLMASAGMKGDAPTCEWQ